MRSRRSALVYVDGFALYKALLQHRYQEYKWLDLDALARRLFPHREVAGVKFFRAPLKPLTNNRGIGQRQQVYWEALRTCGVEIIEGKFHFNKQRLPLHPEQLDANGEVVTVMVKRPEEKGTMLLSLPTSSSTDWKSEPIPTPWSPTIQTLYRR